MTIDQAGLPAGTAGRSRSDGLATGALVTLTSVTVGTTYKFQLLWVPPGDTNAVSSLAATGTPSIWTFTPTALKYGTYRIKLIVDEGLGTEETTIRTLGVKHPSGLLMPAFNEKADPDASLILNTADEIEASENNEVSALTTYQWTGWFDTLHNLTAKADANARDQSIKQAMNEQSTTTVLNVGAWRLKAGTLADGSQLYMGSDTGSDQVTARLKRAANPGVTLATWTVTGGLQNVALTGGDVALPAEDWYYLEIFSNTAIANVLLKGVNLTIEASS